jgi:hypothetical protein
MYGRSRPPHVERKYGIGKIFMPISHRDPAGVTHQYPRWHASCISISGRFVSRRCVVKRQAGFLATVVLLSGTIPLFAQNSQGSSAGSPQESPQRKTSPVLPTDILGPQLIAWSLLQNPQPVAQPTQPAQSQESQEVNPPAQPREPAAQTFTGTITKDGSRYVLKVSNTTAYPLDDQERAKQYEGKQVRVDGTLSPKDNSLHVLNIELIS